MTLSRMCVVTRSRKLRSEMVKITRVNDVWYVDENQTLFGRSIYLILNDANLNKFKKQQKRFKMTSENFDQIIGKLEELSE